MIYYIFRMFIIFFIYHSKRTRFQRKNPRKLPSIIQRYEKSAKQFRASANVRKYTSHHNISIALKCNIFCLPLVVEWTPVWFERYEKLFAWVRERQALQQEAVVQKYMIYWSKKTVNHSMIELYVDVQIFEFSEVDQPFSISWQRMIEHFRMTSE